MKTTTPPIDQKAVDAIKKVLTVAGYSSMSKGPTGNPCLQKVMQDIVRKGAYGSPRAFAEKIGVHPSTIHKILSGDRGISMKTLSHILGWTDYEDVYRLIEAQVEECNEDRS